VGSVRRPQEIRPNTETTVLVSLDRWGRVPQVGEGRCVEQITRKLEASSLLRYKGNSGLSTLAHAGPAPHPQILQSQPIAAS